MSYVKTGLNLTESRKQSIKNAFVNKKTISIKLSASQLNGNDHLGLTRVQYKKVITARNRKTGVTLKLSKTQVAKQGAGWLTSLIPMVTKMAPKILKTLIPTLGLSAISGALSGATNKAVRGEGVIRRRRRKTKGNGLLLGSKSPFRNIPLLNILL